MGDGNATQKRERVVSKSTTKSASERPQTVLYRGATTCDLVPEWSGSVIADPDLLALCLAANNCAPDELIPQLLLADRLGELSDPRERWVRAGVRLWQAASSVMPGQVEWDFNKAAETLREATKTEVGWRLAGMWGCLLAWHCPAGDGSGPMGRTWADERVRVVSRCAWWWALGLLQTRTQADAAWSQAFAARSQANAARSQAFAAGSPAYVAGSEAKSWRYAAALWSVVWAERAYVEVRHT